MAVFAQAFGMDEPQLRPGFTLRRSFVTPAMFWPKS